jgi:uncharacterized membrane protein
VIPVLAGLSGALAVGLAVLAGLATVRGRRLDDVQLVGTAVLEVLLIVQGVVGVVLHARADREDALLFLPYLLTAVLVPPLGLFWALGERSRWGTGVLTLASATVAVVVLRTWQIWLSGG